MTAAATGDGWQVRPPGPAVADYPPGSTFGPRAARYFQFVWVLRGHASWSWSGAGSGVGAGATVDLAPGELLLVRPGMRDSFTWDRRRPTRHAYVHFTGTGGPDLPAPAAWPLVRPFEHRGGVMAALTSYLLLLGDARPAGWQRHAADALRLLTRAFVAGPVESPGHELPPLIASAAGHVADRWSDGVTVPLSVAELARAAGAAPSTLTRAFRREFGVGPVTALERIRLARAEPLLTMSNLTLAAIARQCGFRDAYHFSRRFRAVYGVPPTGFRRAGGQPGPAEDRLRPLAARLTPATPTTPTTPASPSRGPRAAWLGGGGGI